VKPKQDPSIYYKTILKFGIGPLLMLIVVPVIFIPITNYLISIISSIQTVTQLTLLIAENGIIIGIIPAFYYIGIKIGDLLYKEENKKVIIYSNSHQVLRNIISFLGIFLGLLITLPWFVNNLTALLNILFITDWSVSPMFILMSYFLNFYVILFLAFFLGAILRTILLVIIDYLFYRMQIHLLIKIW